MKFGRAVLQSAAVTVIKLRRIKFLEWHPHSKGLSHPLTLQLTSGIAYRDQEGLEGLKLLAPGVMGIFTTLKITTAECS